MLFMLLAFGGWVQGRERGDRATADDDEDPLGALAQPGWLRDRPGRGLPQWPRKVPPQVRLWRLGFPLILFFGKIKRFKCPEV